MWLQRFKEMQRKSGMSLDELSAASGVPKGTLSKISAGITKDPSLENMRALVNAMGYTLDDLAPIEENAPSQREEALLAAFHQLNEDGQEEMLKYADYLLSRGEYLACDQPGRMGQEA